LLRYNVYNPTTPWDNLLRLGGLCTLSEAILESPGKGLRVSHAARARSAPSLGLGGPLEVTGLGGRVSAAGARGLLLVEAHFATTTARSVRLRVPLTERLGSLGLWIREEGGVSFETQHRHRGFR
jgi:hypothetical protein